MTLGSGPKGGPKEIIVWAVKVLRDGTIVSGDSTGEIKIWDGKLHTLRQRIKSHQQDILSLATNFDGSAIFSGGMDRRTVVYKPIGKGKSRWAEVAHRRFHTHDVKTMASFEGSGLSVIVSGGKIETLNNLDVPDVNRTRCFTHRGTTWTVWIRKPALTTILSTGYFDTKCS
jgi:U3 small nucleolar RNA-associated protein 4